MINIPASIKLVVDMIINSGYEAYVVGGCVRDTLMNRTPNDWDITTSGEPEDIKKIFEKTVDTGIKHGTVTVLTQGGQVEVTTYRIDGEYIDNRRPEEVFFTKKIEEDLKRRDFTINAIAYNDIDGMIDLFDGTLDIERKIIRCVGNPNDRFNEDGLRMLRAIRFSAQLGFEIEKETFESIKQNNNLIKNISAERVREELTKILTSSHPEKIMSLHESGLMQHILPEFEKCIGFEQDNPYHIYNVADHTLEAVRNIEKDPVLRWTMLLHDFGKPLTKSFDKKGIGHFYGHGVVSESLAGKILSRLKFDNKSIKKITRLIRFHDYRMLASEKSVRKAVAKIGDDIFLDLLAVQRADDSAKNLEIKKEDIKKSREIEKIYYEIKKKQQCISKGEMKIDGRDLISIGITEGKEIGVILEKLFKLVVEYPEMNDKEKLIDVVKRNRKHG
ncbi:MAG TPA: CCA tRNA nucleotidyltransferase [Clostridiales bacterium]|nr:MAG: polynucleotide adenylyltransferase [Clostridiales bacterium GWD2_32_19]HCC07362.1 CCA tRNA nucleotidyltransferase [Clostridiales bacterium]